MIKNKQGNTNNHKNKLHVKKDDMVLILSGKDKGKKGKVIGAIPKDGKIVVEGLNKVTAHIKPRRQGQPGGRITKEAPMYACKVLPICGKCGKATRVKHILSDGKMIRICKCGESLDK